jgi:ADP-dependent NAD(P)H-hydrate dehydratase / NAD(P)H-hydrate epimerase
VFEPLYSAVEMRAVEERHPGYPDTIPELMERAGRAVAEEAMRAFPQAQRIAVVCGGGSNGGDGRVAVGVLRDAGRLAEETVDVEGADLVIDALFGTGFHAAPRPEAAALIERMNACGAPIVSIDVPSGVDASTGEVAGAAVRAALTVTFAGRKVGLAVAPGLFHAGRTVVADIGLAAAETRHRRSTPTVLAAVPRRGPRDSKYSAGSVLVVGGSPGLTGAVCLAAEAAFRADAGYVAVAVPRASLPVVEARLLEAVKHGLEPGQALDVVGAAAERASAMALGPGLGRGESVRGFVRDVLERIDLPVVLDADALFGLQPFAREAPTVLTPHAGELSRLLGVSADDIAAHRLDAVTRAAAHYGAVVLLKGADTLVAEPSGRVTVCDYGPPSLAVAGTGDVLTGVIAAFLAKGLEPALAAAAGATAHGLAATAVGHRAGLVASDVIAALPGVLDAA